MTGIGDSGLRPIYIILSNSCKIGKNWKGCHPSSSTPCRFANVLSKKHRVKKSTATVESQNTNLIARANSSSLEEWRASDPRRRANAPVNTYSALSSRWRGLSVSDVRTCPTPYALDALAQPSNRILAPRPFHQEDQPTVVPGRLEMVESNPSISVAKIRRKLVLYPFSCSNLGIIPIFRGKT